MKLNIELGTSKSVLMHLADQNQHQDLIKICQDEQRKLTVCSNNPDKSYVLKSYHLMAIQLYLMKFRGHNSTKSYSRDDKIFATVAQNFSFPSSLLT